jgi:hypothetical protein
MKILLAIEYKIAKKTRKKFRESREIIAWKINKINLSLGLVFEIISKGE